MKSRLAILAMLVFGMVFSTTGAGLAIQSLSDGDDASVAQYGNPDETPGDVGGAGSGNGVTGGDGSDASEDLQTTRQAEVGSDSGDELPFTGFLAVPVLIGGVALLSAGMVLRRRTSDD